MPMKTKKFDCGCEFEIGPDGGLIMDMDRIPYGCPRTYKLLANGNGVGLFQVESNLARHYLKAVKPKNIDEIGHVISILRPGCTKSYRINSQGKRVTNADFFVQVRNGEEPPDYMVPELIPILEETNSVIVYQEQVIEIVMKIGGFTEVEADGVRKGIGKKDAELLAKYRDLFIEKAGVVGIITKEQAAELFDVIEAANRYGFNRCSSGRTKIRRDKSGRGRSDFTIEEMYRIRNDIRYAEDTGHSVLRRKWMRLGNYGKAYSMFKDGRIRPNTVVDIQPAGIQKIYLVTLENGASHEATANHKYPTLNGDKQLSELNVGEELYFCGEYEHTQNNYSFSNFTREEMKEKGIKYTNESYSYFHDFRKSTPNVCQKCGKDHGRMEVHHKDGDRANSFDDNLEKLCVSCHKKAQYALGRVRKGQKGYPSLLVKIKSIEEAGECMTYDVTMEAPNHNFVLDSGIVTCNSHACSYAYTCYDTCYQKAHFGVHFYRSTLENVKKKTEGKSGGGPDPMERIRMVVGDMKKNDLNIHSPNLLDIKKTHSEILSTSRGVPAEHFYIKDGKIYFGLADVKDCSEKSIGVLAKVVAKTEELLKKPLENFTWLEFLLFLTEQKVEIGESESDEEDDETPKGRRSGVTKKVLHRLIEVGALHFTLDNATMVGNLERCWKELKDGEKEFAQRAYLESPEKFKNLADLLEVVGKTKKEGGGCHTQARAQAVASMVKLLRDPPASLRDTVRSVAKAEYEALGVAISCSALDGNQKLYQKNITCKEFGLGKNLKTYIMAVEVKLVKPTKTKNGVNPGQPMGFLVIDDGTLELDNVVVFPTEWAEYADFFYPNAQLLLKGERDSRKGSFIVKEVSQL
jgi:hypothetical protein